MTKNFDCEILGFHHSVFGAFWDVTLRDIIEEENPQEFEYAAAKYLLNIEVCKEVPQLDCHGRFPVVFFSPLKT